ncbi:MAG: hypothetical protein HYX52_02180 [Chloroflexi bacterium]|nr:hypothetical protein [Chloroflexota bacterium]
MHTVDNDTENDQPNLRFDRLLRTPHSEAFLLSDGETAVGRVDLHYGSAVVHALLVLEREVLEEELQGIIARIDRDLVQTADRPREDFLVTVYQGEERGVYSDEPDVDLLDGEESELP